jgi:hypothetical protein
MKTVATYIDQMVIRHLRPRWTSPMGITAGTGAEDPEYPALTDYKTKYRRF